MIDMVLYQCSPTLNKYIVRGGLDSLVFVFCRAGVDLVHYTFFFKMGTGECYGIPITLVLS